MDAQNNLISCFIACHNHGKYVYNAVKSVAEQSLPPSEIILIDDGSTDNTAMEFMRAIQDFSIPFTVKSHMTRMGHIQSYNEATEMCVGKFIHLMAADDLILSPEFYSMAMELFIPKVGAVTCELVHMDEDGNQLPQRSRIPFHSTICEPRRALEEMAKMGNFICGGGTLARKEALHPYREDMPYTADFFQWIGILKRGWWLGAVRNSTQNMVYGYRQHPGSMSAHTRGTIDERFICSEALKAALDRTNVDTGSPSLVEPGSLAPKTEPVGD